MNQELKEKLHYYLPHGLKVLRPDNRTILDIIGWENDETLYTREPNNDRSICGFDGCRPFMRPLSYLTKEIVVEGYNDGKPFAPVIDLLNIRYKFDSSKHTLIDNAGYVKIKFGIQPNQTDPILNYNEMRLSIDQWSLLFQWHFWIGDQALFDTGEIIRIEG